MAVYQSGIKGLFTESNPQDTAPETMQDCNDVTISRDNLAESRHGINTQKITRSSGNWDGVFIQANSKLSVFKIDFDFLGLGAVRKYVLLGEGSTGMRELNTSTDLTGTITFASSSIPTTYTGKPIGFTFDQSFYIVGATGWQEMSKNILNSGATGVKKTIQWPTIKALTINNVTDSNVPANNWLQPGKRVGIRLTYVWNTRYNDELPREVESYPSSIYEFDYVQSFQPTIAPNSFIRVALSAASYNGYTTNINGRRFYLRVYRTKAVNIGEALPTEYFQAHPDAPLSEIPTNFDLTLNDDGIIALPQLYTNPNLDGEANSNTVPPIAQSVTEYKNYFVAANIREPLRAYITMVAPPFTKNAQFFRSVGSAAASNETFTSFSVDTNNWTTSDIPALAASPANTYAFHSYLWDNGTNVTAFSDSINGIVVADNSFPYTLTNSNASPFRLYFDGTFAQTNAALKFQFTDETGAITTITPNSIDPVFNRPGYYFSTDSNGLQFAGSTYEEFIRKNGYAALRKLPYTSNAGNINSNLRIVMLPGAGNGYVKPDAQSLSSFAGSTLTVGADSVIAQLDSATTGIIDIGAFQEPGIIYVRHPTNAGVFSYKTVSVSGTNQIKFENATKVSPGAFTTATGTTFEIFYIPGSQANALPIYLNSLSDSQSLIFNLATEVYTNIPWVDVSLLPVKGSFAQPIGVVDASKLVYQNGLPMIEGTLFGVTALSPAQIIDLSVTNLVQKCNEAANNDRIKFIKTENVGEFLVEYYGGDKIEAGIASGGTHSYEPPLSTSYTTVAEYKKNNERAISISRYNAPESFPNSTVLAPILVGSDKAKVVALAKNSNDCFVLKEDGIWRLSITGNSSLPFVDEVTQLDTTTYCQAPYSVQEINEEVIFLSQKGFISITGNQIEAIGRPIETEVKEKLQRAIANSLQNEIRSWVNEEKRIYGCTIRDTTATYTTYVLNTYTRNWTKFSLPVIDATTDSKGRTLYAIGMPDLDLGSGATLQEQLATVSGGSTIRYYLTEELHTDGSSRSEIDQWDYRYIPSSANASDNQVLLIDNSDVALPSWTRLGGSGTSITSTGLSFFVNRSAYYKKSNIFYPCTFVSRGLASVIIEFAEVPADIETISGDDGLYAGVPASITFNPSNIGAPNTNKVFSEYQLHTVESVSSLTMQFITDSRSTYTNPRVFAFNRDASSRTVYRSYIPVEAMRGRWIIRKVEHDVPGERLICASQSLTVRDTGSSRIQKAPR